MNLKIGCEAGAGTLRVAARSRHGALGFASRRSSVRRWRGELLAHYCTALSSGGVRVENSFIFDASTAFSIGMCRQLGFGDAFWLAKMSHLDGIEKYSSGGGRFLWRRRNVARGFHQAVPDACRPGEVELCMRAENSWPRRHKPRAVSGRPASRARPMAICSARPRENLGAIHGMVGVVFARAAPCAGMARASSAYVCRAWKWHDRRRRNDAASFLLFNY